MFLPGSETGVKGGGVRVVGATVNGTGSLVRRAERVGSEPLLARLVRMVAAAQRSRAPIQKVADRVAGTFVPAVLAVAVLTFAVWGAFGQPPRMAHALVNAVAGGGVLAMLAATTVVSGCPMNCPSPAV